MRTSKNRVHPKSGWCNIKKLPKGTEGRALCRFCKKEVPKGRRSFCGNECVHEWKLRSNPSYLRTHTFKRDLGVCKNCGIDTIIKQQELRKKYQTIPLFINGKQNPDRLDFLKQNNITAHHLNTTLWQADHIVPVVEGGGLCGLDGIRTLCIWCHKEETKALRSRLKERRGTNVKPKKKNR